MLIQRGHCAVLIVACQYAVAVVAEHVVHIEIYLHPGFFRGGMMDVT
jgi:hypothetical protein